MPLLNFLRTLISFPRTLDFFSRLNLTTMDPLSAIGLASAIITFIDFGCGLVSDAHDIYRSENGLIQGLEEIDGACERSKELAVSIRSKIDTADHETLDELAEKCLSTAEEITEVLDGMRSAHDGKRTGKLKSLRKAFVQYRGRDKVEKLNRTLQNHSRDLSRCLIFMTR